MWLLATIYGRIWNLLGPVLVLALQLLPAIVQIPAQDVLETAVLELRHDLADLPALPQPRVDFSGDLRRQLPAARVLAGVGWRVVVGGGPGCDVVVDDPHVAVAEGLDALELERAVALFGGALGHAGGLAGLAVAGLAGAEADPTDLALALAHIAGAAHAHRVAARDGELVQLELHGGTARDGVALGRDLHGHHVLEGLDHDRVGRRGRGELLLLLLLLLRWRRWRRWRRGDGLGRAYGGGIVCGGEGHDGVVINAIVVLGLGRGRRGRRVDLELVLLLGVMLMLGRVRLVLLVLLLLLCCLYLVLLLLVLGAQGALAGRVGREGEATFSSEDGLDCAEALVDVVEALVDQLVDALVDDGGEGVCEGAEQVGWVGDKEWLAVRVRHPSPRRGQATLRGDRHRLD